jgi:hypothetical protein
VRWSGPPRPHAQGRELANFLLKACGPRNSISGCARGCRIFTYTHSAATRDFQPPGCSQAQHSPRQTRPTAAVRQPPVTAASLRIVRLQQCVLDLLSCWPATCAWTAPLRGAELRHEHRVLDLRCAHFMCDLPRSPCTPVMQHAGTRHPHIRQSDVSGGGSGHLSPVIRSASPMRPP